jgi:hypothetical protein
MAIMLYSFALQRKYEGQILWKSTKYHTKNRTGYTGRLANVSYEKLGALCQRMFLAIKHTGKYHR